MIHPTSRAQRLALKRKEFDAKQAPKREKSKVRFRRETLKQRETEDELRAAKDLDHHFLV